MDKEKDKLNYTHFGYQKVRVEEKAHKVAEVFKSVANKYDVMNDLMSLGLHRLWKRYAIELSGVRPGQQVLDLAGGTGDLARAFAKRVGDQGRIVLADINDAMLQKGRERLTDAGIVKNIEYVQLNAECLAFADNTFDCVTMAFGLRNVTDKAAALKSIYRVLKPGGKLIVLEFSKPMSLLQPIYDIYSFSVLPRLGKWIANDADSYRYLAESIRMHPDQNTLIKMLEDAGFTQCDFHNLTGGIVAVHRGQKV